MRQALPGTNKYLNVIQVTAGFNQHRQAWATTVNKIGHGPFHQKKPLMANVAILHCKARAIIIIGYYWSPEPEHSYKSENKYNIKREYLSFSV